MFKSPPLPNLAVVLSPNVKSLADLSKTILFVFAVSKITSSPKATFPRTSNFDAGLVVPIPRFPVESITAFCVPAVVNVKASSSDPGVDSARIKVSPSTSLTPPREPQSPPGPYPSNDVVSVLYLI